VAALKYGLYKGKCEERDGSSGSCTEILVGGVFGLGAEPIVERVRDVEDDLGVFLGGSGFEGDGAVGVEELVGDVGEDGGAAGGDAAFGDEGEEAAEELADVGAGGELGEFGEEVGGEMGEIALVLLECGTDGGTSLEVSDAKTKTGSRGEFATALAVGKEMLAAALSGRPRTTRLRCRG